jgi:ankyrin repeat protein
VTKVNGPAEAGRYVHRFAIVVAVVLLGGALVLRAAGNSTPLIDAARTGDAAAVARLIAEKAPVDAAEPDGTTALHWAARADNLDIARRLVRAGAPVGRATRYGITPLALAAINGSAPLVDLLLQAGADPNTAGPGGDTVLMLAARTGAVAAVDLLVARGANPDARETWQGETALMWAAAENHADVVRRLAAAGADLNARSTVPEFPKVKVDAATMVFTALPRGGLTAMMLAARQGAGAAVAALADAGADLDATDPDGTSALVIAIINAHYDVAAVLIDKGANLDVADTAGMTPLYAAVDMQHQENMINRPLPKPSGRLRPLDVVTRLLARGANPNAVLKSPLLMRQHTGGDAQLGAGATPLMRAAKVGDSTLLRLLLERGADPNLRLRNGNTALMVAAARAGRNAGPEQRTIDAIRTLMTHGADITAANETGETALHIAVGRGDTLVRFLAENGARLDATDNSGRTPLDIALGVPAAAPAGGRGGRGGGGRGGGAPAVRASTAELLRELMAGASSTAR